MKINNTEIKIPTLVFRSDYFHCPKCGWQYPGPLLIKGNVAPTTPCGNPRCKNSYLVRVK